MVYQHGPQHFLSHEDFYFLDLRDTNLVAPQLLLQHVANKIPTINISTTYTPITPPFQSNPLEISPTFPPSLCLSTPSTPFFLQKFMLFLRVSINLTQCYFVNHNAIVSTSLKCRTLFLQKPNSFVAVCFCCSGGGGGGGEKCPNLELVIIQLLEFVNKLPLLKFVKLIVDRLWYIYTI